MKEAIRLIMDIFILFLDAGDVQAISSGSEVSSILFQIC